MKEYIVTKDILNIRSKASDESDDTFVGELKKDEIVWLDETPVMGVIPKGGTTDIWLRRTDNPSHVVALDGVRPKNYEDKKKEFVNDAFNKQFIDSDDPYNENKWKVSWGHVDLEIWKIWRDYKTMGEGVNVVVFDTGISPNRDDFQNVSDGAFINGLPEAIIDDLDGHGTNSAGILGATGGKVIFGIAPKANLYILKFAKASGGPSSDRFTSGLNLLKEKNWKPDILSVSYCYKNDFGNAMDFLKDKCLIVSALDHNMGNGFMINDQQFPAFSDSTIPVVSYNKGSNELLPCSLLSQKYNWAFPGKDISTLDKNGRFFKGQQTSISTPLAAGIMALFVSYMKKKKIEITSSNLTLLKELLISPDPVNLLIDKVSVKINYCNPLTAFSKLDTIFKTK